jgi:ketosteroid isomerase-like protein
VDPPVGQVTTPIDAFGDFAALDPFFRIIEDGLAGFVDDGHFFDLLAEDVIFEYVVSVPGYPRRVEGRRAVAELYRGYGSNIVLRSADELAVHRDREASVIVLEYAVHGQAVHTGRPYDNHFVSVITSRTARSRVGATTWTQLRSSTRSAGRQSSGQLAAAPISTHAEES